MSFWIAPQIVGEELYDLGMDMSRYRWVFVDLLNGQVDLIIAREGPSNYYTESRVTMPIEDLSIARNLKKATLDAINMIWDSVGLHYRSNAEIGRVLEWRRNE